MTYRGATRAASVAAAAALAAGLVAGVLVADPQKPSVSVRDRVAAAFGQSSGVRVSIGDVQLTAAAPLEQKGCFKQLAGAFTCRDGLLYGPGVGGADENYAPVRCSMHGSNVARVECGRSDSDPMDMEQ